MVRSTYNLLSYHLVAHIDFGGYWIEKPVEKTMQCYGQHGGILHCEYENCISNCQDTYDVLHDTLTLKRDLNVFGMFRLPNKVEWGSNKTWIRKGTLSG